MGMDRLTGRVAIVTGASRGIGQAIAERFAQEGADLILCATRLKNLDETKAMVAACGRKAIPFGADVIDRQAAETIVENGIDAFGRIDILINNAGIYKTASFLDHSYEDFDKVMKVNVYGPFNMLQPVLKHMIGRKAGKVVNIASVAGVWAVGKQSAYVASKHALIGLTKALGQEMAEYGINVNAVCPGITETDLIASGAVEQAEALGISPEQVLDTILQRIPMKRWLQPREIADLCLYLASSESDGMTGKSLIIDAGMLPV